MTVIVMQLNQQNVTDKQLDQGLTSGIPTIPHSTNSAGHLKSYIRNNFYTYYIKICSIN